MLLSILYLSSLTHAIQPGAAPAIAAPLRDLVLGDINFLHTTDTHGWHAGHLLEPSYSADWGDYLSFTHHLRTHLESTNRDLLVIDTGDRIEGNGLYDASIPRGLYTFPIVNSVSIDVLSVGNHELYKNTSARDDYNKLVSKHYLATNLDIYINDTLAPFADRYREFTTKHGIKILAFGFIFDFTRNDKNTVVIPVEHIVKEQWFIDVVSNADVDLFLVIGHVALRQTELDVIYHAIRRLSSTTIQFFGGHFHIRDARLLDDRAFALASGRFMETIGFASLSGLKSTSQSNPHLHSQPQSASSTNITFFRRYIDNNLFSLYHHSNTTPSTFNTPSGLTLSNLITISRTALSLDTSFGCSPKTFWMSRVPYPHPSSIFSLLTDNLFPDIINEHRSPKSRLIITNTGAIRFDIFPGPFTRDSTFIVSPFTSDLSYVGDVPWKAARRILSILNGGETPVNVEAGDDEDHDMEEACDIRLEMKNSGLDLSMLVMPEQRAKNWRRAMCFTREHNNDDKQKYGKGPERYEGKRRFPRGFPRDPRGLGAGAPKKIPQAKHVDAQESREQVVIDGEKVTPGYTTHDDFGDDGDDTIHAPVEYFDVPNCVQAVFPKQGSNISLEDEGVNETGQDDEVIDLVFNQFLTPYVLRILNLLGDKETTRNREGKVTGETMNESHHYTDADVENYVPGQTFTSVLANWIAKNWPCDEHKEL